MSTACWKLWSASTFIWKLHRARGGGIALQLAQHLGILGHPIATIAARWLPQDPVDLFETQALVAWRRSRTKGERSSTNRRSSVTRSPTARRIGSGWRPWPPKTCASSSRIYESSPAFAATVMLPPPHIGSFPPIQGAELVSRLPVYISSLLASYMPTSSAPPPPP